MNDLAHQRCTRSAQGRKKPNMEEQIVGNKNPMEITMEIIDEIHDGNS
jgi:hypothetical protein